jgi:carboxyl-terminal processing protease
VRRALIGVCGLVVGCTDSLVGRDPVDTPAGRFATVWRDFDRNYALFVEKDIDWNAIRAQYQPHADTARSMEAVANVIGLMFQELTDLHVDLFVPPNRLYRSIPQSSSTYFSSTTVFSKYVTSSQQTPSGMMRFGKVTPDVGYVWIPSFGGSGGGWPSEIDAVLESLGDVIAVIIDVRDNGGGNSGNAEAIAARFMGAERIFAHIRWRSGPAHTDLTNYIELRLQPAGRSFRGRVVVLTNRRAASAAEHFVLAMSTQTSVTILGDSTAGAFGNPMIRELPGGWVYRVPQWIEYDAHRKLYEEVGYPPDILVEQTAADSTAGVDQQLEQALATALTASSPARSSRARGVARAGGTSSSRGVVR